MSTIGIKNISGIKQSHKDLISKSKHERDFKIDKLQETAAETMSSKPSCGELKLDVYRDAQNLYIIAQMMGVKKKDLVLTLNFDVLMLEGRQEFPIQVKPLIPLTKECSWGEFRRRIVLPEDVDTTQLQAKFEEGVLLITIPIVEKAKMKVIEIN